ncbi:transcription elongation factor SPT4 [Histomonas meleagridis]|uniref:transcription elongation factor SPT4 n=1 Tax=Histomonas meleagridis TaxID=135588 RepID=UPI00355A4D9B|nr:transcription elongation factor SPT4 [Histomonas meleagridis]KAH0800592.1 transcription elongation factor SPT4 [Histomonas meleagridis]
MDDIEIEIPQDLRKCRACIGCGLIQTTDWWKGCSSDLNCPNCRFDNFKWKECTSASFSGMLAIFKPEISWCAKWQRYNTNVVGLYTLYNDGEVTKNIIDQLKRNKRPFPEWVEKASKEISK